MIIAEHSVDLSLIKRDSKVLDLGCRYFGFANAMLEYIDEIYCVDADSSVKKTDERIKLIHVAVGNDVKVSRFVKWGNGTGNYLEDNEQRPGDCQVELVQVWTLAKICKYFGIHEWDLIKIDIEGEEYDVLMGLTYSIATQISFEMHQHTQKKRPMEDIHKLFNHLSRWYEFKVVDYSEKHGCGKNYWDVLVVRK